LDPAEVSLDERARREQVRPAARAGSRDRGEPSSILLRNATLCSGQLADVLLQAGHIAAMGPAASSRPGATAAQCHDLTGYLLLPSAVEPHAHLDKAMLGDRYPNEPGDLLGAIRATRRAYPSMQEPDILHRARAALMTAVAHGYTAVRTHATCEAGIGTRALRALCTLRDECVALADLQVAAMIGMPLTGRDGAEQRALLDEVVSLGADLVGGAPALDGRPAGALPMLTAAAADAGLPVDLHIDETTDAGMQTLRTFVDEVGRSDCPGGRRRRIASASASRTQP
jgi:cytosine/creatinine deaminase